MFSHVVSGHVTDVAPIDFTEAILVLTARGGAADGGMRFEEVVDSGADELEISIGDHLAWETADFSNELLELSIDAVRAEVFEAEAKFLTGFTINKEEGIMDAANGTTITVANVVVDDIAKTVRTGDRNLVAILFGESGSFTAGCYGITAGISNQDGVFGKSFEMFEYFFNVAKAKALL